MKELDRRYGNFHELIVTHTWWRICWWGHFIEIKCAAKELHRYYGDKQMSGHQNLFAMSSLSHSGSSQHSHSGHPSQCWYTVWYLWTTDQTLPIFQSSSPTKIDEMKRKKKNKDIIELQISKYVQDHSTRHRLHCSSSTVLDQSVQHSSASVYRHCNSPCLFRSSRNIVFDCWRDNGSNCLEKKNLFS